MSDKKQLLTESEIRRFMKLANIPAIGKEEVVSERMGMNQIPEDPRREAMGSPQEEGMMGEEDMDMGAGAEAGDEMMDVGDLAGEAGGDKEAKFQEIVNMLADLIGVDVEVEAGEGEEAPEMGGEEAGEEKAPEAPKMGGEEAGEEAGEEEEEEGDEEEMQEGKHEEEEELDEAKKEEKEEEEELDEKKEEEDEGKKLDENLVNTILARVTARLIEEAKKKKAEKKKKMTAAEKMKALKEKKKKLDEANAPAPKSTMSNASKAGVAKAAGKADKGTWGVSSKVADMEWKQGKEGKGGHEMSAETASAEHIITHGKKNLATMGGNKKK